MSKKSLSEKFIYLVHKAYLDDVKSWVEQTNLNNQTYILESTEIAKKENSTHFFRATVCKSTVGKRGELVF